jgi:hypothetical protein
MQQQTFMVLDQPDAIELFRLKTIRRLLKLEIDTGMRHSRNAAMKAATAITGKRTRKDCYEALDAFIKSLEAPQPPSPEE